MKITFKSTALLFTCLVLITTSCTDKCKVCEVIKNGAVIEKYESCGDEGKQASETICKEMAKLQQCDCICRDTDVNEMTMITEDMPAFITVAAAKEYIQSSFTKNEERLPIANSLLDSMGMNMALIGDALLKKGYTSSGYEQTTESRVFICKKE